MPKKWINFVLIFLVFPASGAYKLDGFTFGGGGQMVGSSNYGANVVVGEQVNNNLVGNSYDLGAGLAFVNQVATPQSPTLENSENNYNKLHYVINKVSQTGVTFPGDTKFAIAISNDNFATTQYIKVDNTVGSTLSLADYRDYPGWGGSSGDYVVGLDVGTSYWIKVRAIQTKYNESGWSDTVGSSTGNSYFNFAINVGTGYTQAPPPYQIDLGDLINGNVVTSSKKVWIDMDANTSGGGNVYISGQNGGLFSSLSGYKIDSASTDLGSTSVGFGVQGSGTTQISGGPLTVVSPYDGSGNIVGQISTTLNRIFKSDTAVVGGRASFVLKAKSANDTPEGSDYSEVITVIGSPNY